MAGFFFMRRCASGPSNPHNHDEGGGGGVIHAVGEVLAYPAYPGNCELINKTLEYLDTHAHKHDQYAFNVVLADLEKNKEFQYTLLDPLLFCNGAIYFSDRSPQVENTFSGILIVFIFLCCSATAPSTFLIARRRCALKCALICALILAFCTCASIFLFCFADRTQQMLGRKAAVVQNNHLTGANFYFFFGTRQMLGIKAVVVQNNHLTGANSKRHRFREHLLWYLDFFYIFVFFSTSLCELEAAPLYRTPSLVS
jgi:hypothetical protein